MTGLATASHAQTKARRPNIVFLLCDDLGYGDLACYGHPTIRTPRLDALAKEGVRLTDCYAAAPVCSPARAGIMAGRNPYRCRIPDWIPENTGIHLHATEISVAALLKSAGYRTAHCGK
ncbi:MAG TPA: arylsulfatase, partial [Candidatus Hydrogenedentes bacterium]|nr:arylsulfatase [Candidatus Hydrogenedentota bacterium]